jgi:ActR/RegA family two-component response regulator
MVSWQDSPRGDIYRNKVEQSHRDSGRILLVEDDIAFAKSMNRLLTGVGFEVSMAHSGAAARALLAADDFHLALVDMNLPDASGHEIVKEIKDNRINTAAIVVSGETEIDAAINALRAGASPNEILHAPAITGIDFIFTVGLDKKFFGFPDILNGDIPFNFNLT